MEQVTFNISNDNPFYGMKNCLTLFENTGNTITTDMLDKAYSECNTKEKKELFYSLLFSIGDITARQHNIFKGKKRDNGGNANREGFHEVIRWMWNHDQKQFCKFLVTGLFNEYSCFDILLRNRVKSDRKGKVISTYNPFSNALYRETIISYLYSIIKGTNPFNKYLVAKFLTLPRLTHRKGHKKMLKETYQVMWYRAKLLEALSRLMGWEYELTPTKANFKGYREWRQQYNGELESVLFSTGKINEFKKDEFIEWLDKLPSQARFRVKKRVLYSKMERAIAEDNGIPIESGSLKYPKLKLWYEEWEKYKESKQQEQRVLEEKVRQNQATEEDVIKLQKVKKEAKVTVGATNFKELYDDILRGTIDKLKLESFMNRVNLPYNSLVIIDDSGSMWGEPFRFAQFIASVCLVKNPDDDARNLIGMFANNSIWYSFIDSKAKPTANSLMRTQVAEIAVEPLVDPIKSFYDNYKRISSFLASKFRGGLTRVDTIPDNLYAKVQENPELLDAVKSYPVWTIISDADFNNMPNPKASMQIFFDKCEKYFGFKPFVVAIAIDKNKDNSYHFRNRATEFEGIDNFMYIPSNPAQIEQFLTNFKDIEKFDAYTPLLSIYRSNRYDLVRNNVI